jgi:cation diffusion facilitator family transporter
MSPDRAAQFAIGSIVIGVLVLALKLGAWWLTGSVALYSDALESTVNVATAIIALLALRLSAKPADDRHPYGHHKIEYIAAVIEGALILVAALLVLHAAYEAFMRPRAFTLEPAAIALNIGASIINGVWCRVLISRGRALRSPALIADGKHLQADVVSSIGVIIALFAAQTTGLPWLDPLIACAVALNILVSGWLLMQASFGGLMDEAASPDELNRIRAVIASEAQGAIEAHDLRTRASGRMTFIEFHLVVPAEMRVDVAHDICDRIEKALRDEVGSASITIHVEPENKAKHQGIVVL